MKSLRFFAVIFLLFASLSAHAASRIQYILDVSGSMNALTAGERRMDVAKKSLNSMVQGIPDGTIVALRLYSHRVPPSDKAASCQDTELVIPFGPINKPAFLAIVNAATPLGQTPIAYSLEQASKDFVMGADEQQTIILLSDGEESCGGDPVAVAKSLLAKGFKLKINVIGLDVDAAAKNQLASIASATGGQYFDAKDTASLTGSLQKLTSESLVIQKAGASVFGEEIRGGDNYETAVPLTPGKLFRLNHHQKVNEYDYFYVEAKPGQKIKLSLETTEKGVTINPDNTSEDNLRPYAGIGLHSPQKTKIRHEEIIGGTNDARQIEFAVPSDGTGRYYILVGSAYDAQHKDHRFKVEITDQFDAGTKQDAGDTRDTALPIQAATIKGFLTPNDQTDTYRVTLPAGMLNLKVRPASEKARLNMVLFDADGVEMARNMAPNDGAICKIENVNLPKAGEYILKVESIYSASVETEYTVEIQPAAGGLPAGVEAGAPPATTAAASPAPSVPTPTTPTTPAAPAAPSAPATVTTAPIMKPSPWPGGGPSSKAMCEGFKLLPLWEKVKFLAFWSGIPLVAGWLIGWLWGYLKGRKSGFRKAAKVQMKQQSAPPPPPPPAAPKP